MERLGQIITNSALGQENQETIKAATIVAAASKAIQDELQLTPAEARAVTYRHGEVTIKTYHGAVSGQLLIHQEQIIKTANQALAKIYRGQESLIKQINIRPH